MQSLLLDLQNWDLCLDAAGNIAVASLPYAAAQDAACAIKLMQGEYWFDTTIGVPYFQQILGKRPPLGLARAKFVQAAKTQPSVKDARVFFTGFSQRKLSGQVQVTDINGNVSFTGF